MYEKSDFQTFLFVIQEATSVLVPADETSGSCKWIVGTVAPCIGPWINRDGEVHRDRSALRCENGTF